MCTFGVFVCIAKWVVLGDKTATHKGKVDDYLVYNKYTSASVIIERKD